MELKRLGEAMALQTGLLEELNLLLERETAAFAEIKLPLMTELNSAKEELTRRIEAHAPVLRQAIKAAAIREGLDPAATLGTIAQKLAKKGKQDIVTLYGTLNKAADRVQQTATLNREIAERFVMSVNTSLELIARLANQSSVYGSTGGYQQRPTGAVIVNMEA